MTQPAVTEKELIPGSVDQGIALCRHANETLQRLEQTPKRSVNYIFKRASFWDEVMAYTRQFVPPAKASGAGGRIKGGAATTKLEAA